ncbi:MAG: hypothetical protein ACJ77A_12465 [Actinomycetota bacterium]
MAVSRNGVGSVTERMAGIGRLLTTLDQRLLETFDTLDRVGEASAALDGLASDGTDLVADLRSRMERLDRKVRADMNELKQALLAKLDEVDLSGFDERLQGLEVSIRNIETAVTRMDRVVEGAVEGAPGFVKRRVREGEADVAEEIPQA